MNDQTNQAVAQVPQRVSLLAKIASRYDVDPSKLMGTLKATAFRQRDNAPVSDEQMMALLIVADQYQLNPFTKEIYAYPDKDKGIVPVVSIDGWARIMNSHPSMDGVEFAYSPETLDHKGHKVHEWIDATIHIKGRKIPVTIREFFGEVVRKPNFPTPWDTHPSRMHRHKALIQCARVAFGFAGIYDDDEAQRIIEHNVTAHSEVVERSPISDKIRGNKPEPAVDQEIIEVAIVAEETIAATVGDEAATASANSGDVAEPTVESFTADIMAATTENQIIELGITARKLFNKEEMVVINKAAAQRVVQLNAAKNSERPE